MRVRDIKAMIAGKTDDEEIFEIINRNDYVAMKLWTRDDIAKVLKGEGYATTKENIDTVVNSGFLKPLEDCDDGDWGIMTFSVYVCGDKELTKSEEN